MNFFNKKIFIEADSPQYFLYNGIIFNAISTNFTASSVEQLKVDLDKKGFELIFLKSQGSSLHYACFSSISLLYSSNLYAIDIVCDSSGKYNATYNYSFTFQICAF